MTISLPQRLTHSTPLNKWKRVRATLVKLDNRVLTGSLQPLK